MKIIGIEDQNDKQKEAKRKRNFIIGLIIFIILIVTILIATYMLNINFRNFMDKYVLMKNVMEDSLVSITLDETDVNNIYAYDKYIVILKRK